ncbi:pyridoxal-phosphate-dependent aminotransferase family protein [Chloroflexota bacterium]
MKHKRLFIPGPVEVEPEILQAMGTPMIGHRSSEFKELYAEVQPKLQKLLYTENPVFLSTSSATGIMEGSIRNLVGKRCLSLVCGAFSERWHGIAGECDKGADAIEVEWGKAIKPEQVDEALATGKYDAVALVHNETSTGVMNPLEAIARVVKKYPDVMLMVDTVSSMTGVKIEVDKLGLDVCLAGTQKAFALPPGLCVFTVSQRALERSANMKGRGFYFDFQAFLKYHEKQNTPCTPSVSHIFALNVQMDRMFREGLENRFTRHQEMAEYCRSWARERFALFPEEGYESITLTTVANTREIDISALNKALAAKDATIGNGYGKLKDKTFRIAHMGDCTLDQLKELLANIDEILDGR